MVASVLGPHCRLWQWQGGLHQGSCEPVVGSPPGTGVDGEGLAPGVGPGSTCRRVDDDGEPEHTWGFRCGVGWCCSYGIGLRIN